MINLKEKWTGVIRTVACSMKADESVPKSEQVTVYLDIDFSDCDGEDMASFAAANRKIAFQNGAEGRKKCGKYHKGQHIAVKASSPGRKVVDIDAEHTAMFETKSYEDQQAEIDKLLALQAANLAKRQEKK